MATRVSTNRSGPMSFTRELSTRLKTLTSQLEKVGVAGAGRERMRICVCPGRAHDETRRRRSTDCRHFLSLNLSLSLLCRVPVAAWAWRPQLCQEAQDRARAILSPPSLTKPQERGALVAAVTTQPRFASTDFFHMLMEVRRAPQGSSAVRVIRETHGAASAASMVDKWGKRQGNSGLAGVSG